MLWFNYMASQDAANLEDLRGFQGYLTGQAGNGATGTPPGSASSIFGAMQG
jgi:hypothetical protein